MKLEARLDLNEVADASNVAEMLSEEDLQKIGETVVKEFDTDLLSRSDWEERTKKATELALQVSATKNFPWPNASNVKFPLITIAALQYHARAYPTLVTDTPVKCRVFGDDPSNEKAERAYRVQDHMSYQLMEEDSDWESEMDKVLLTQPIIGCAFKKTFFHPIKKQNESENIFARDLVVNYWTKSLETAPRITHILYYSNNEVYERVQRGLWLDIAKDEEGKQAKSAPFVTTLGQQVDKRQGTTPPESVDSSTPNTFLEQHRYLDLDGDGYEEPYIVTVCKDGAKVVRIAARFFQTKIERNQKKEVVHIEPEQYFTKFPFIPSPDGGFYDIGFGVLLGPLNESINTSINQLIDAGTMSMTAGGFIAKGMKVRSGKMTFAPLEWKHVESTGDDIRKNIVPLPTKEPSPIMFQLLSLLINYGERIGGAVDIMVGQNPGQNTPAETSRTMVEQGMKIFSGIFKRTYRALKEEYRKLYRLNQLYLDTNVEYMSETKGAGRVLARDYQGPVSDVRPAADPNVASDSQRMTQAMAVRQAAGEAGLYDRWEVEKRFLEAMKVPDIDKILPAPGSEKAPKPPPPDPKVQVAQIQAEVDKAQQQLDVQIALAKLQQEVALQQAKIHKLEAEARLALAQADAEANGQKIAELNTQIGLAKAKQEGLSRSMEIALQMSDKMRTHNREDSRTMIEAYKAKKEMQAPQQAQ